MSRTRVDVVLDALGLEVLRTRGTRAWIACPFHESASKSAFFVRRAGEKAGTYHCFRCKAAGNLDALAAHVRGLDEEDARLFVRKLGEGFRPERRRVRVVARPAELSRARFRMPAEVVSRPWGEWAEEPREYLEGRGLGREEAEAFRIGYAVDGPLAGRVVIPYLDERGRPGSYSARTVVGDEPKYRTPEERSGFRIETVFGSHLWPPPAERRGAAVVVTEGAVDAMSVRRAAPGVVHVAALNGSEPDPGQLLQLATFGIVLDAMDDDDAGDAAARAIRFAVARHAGYARLRLPRDANAMLAGDRGAGAAPRPRALRRMIVVALEAARAIMSVA